MNQEELIRKLVGKGLLNPDQVREIERLADQSGQRIDHVMAVSGFVHEADLVPVVAEAYGVPHVTLYGMKPSPEVLSLLPSHIAQKYQAIPYRREGNRLHVAMVDPLNMIALDDLRRMTGLQIVPALCGILDFRRAFNALYRMQEEVERLLSSQDPDADEPERFPPLDILPGDSSAVRVVKAWLMQAANLGASDVHIEPHRNHFILRYRIDGILRDIATIQKSQVNVVAALKVMAGMRLDVALPQEGRFRRHYHGMDLDFRVSSLPTIYGDKIAIRIINQSTELLDIHKLALSEHNLRLMLDLLSRPSGVILVVGPTGSGKTTTMFAALNYLNTPERNLVTIEEPVEIILPRVNQVNINVDRQFTYDRALKALVRQDPDVIMVGEIRDTPEAQMIMHMGMVGSLVLTTVHAYDAATAPIRLIQMGVPQHIAAAALQGVISQRLVRKICENCKIQVPVTDEDRRLLQVLKLEEEPDHLWAGQGCERCFHTGYAGRVALHEILVFDEELRDLLSDPGVTASRLRNLALKKTMVPMIQDGYQKVSAGITTLSEVIKEVHRE